MTPLTTSRLRLRNVRDDDFPFIYRLQSDPEIMRYIRAPVTEEAPVRERMAMWKQYNAENPDLGVFVLENLVDGEVIGHGVFRHAQFKPGHDIEVGYLLLPEHAGRGYATECVHGLQAYATEQLGLDKLVAFTDPENAASNRVLEKCGFERDGLEEIADGVSQHWVWKKAGSSI